MNILKNAFLENLAKDEFVAINAQGTPIGRASSKEALEQAHAGVEITVLDAKQVAEAGQTLAEAATAKLDGPFAAVVAQGVAAQPGTPETDADPANPNVRDPDGNEPLDAAPPTAEEQVAKMDPDGDGKIGGAPKGGNKKKAGASK